MKSANEIVDEGREIVDAEPLRGLSDFEEVVSGLEEFTSSLEKNRFRFDYKK